MTGWISTCVVWFGIAGLAAGAAAEPPAAPAGALNHLARESSPYLLHHARNPVDWYPWGPAAFAKAKQENKLVFLSSGYHACHWCHVMERESFMNLAIAAILNKHFVCIKLDREERPEIDHVYLTALNAMGQNGGWPLSMFLTADAKPIAGGTYWPPEDREREGVTVTGFQSVLKNVIEFYEKSPEDIRRTADLRAEQTRRMLQLGRGIAPVVPPTRALVDNALEELGNMFDPQHGGFGQPPGFRGPKFPRSPHLQLLQYEQRRTPTDARRRIVETTLDHMAEGGLYDHVGGGFHRYCTERTWTVPHFEKMLSDNAQLLEVYAAAYADTKKPLYRRVLQETLAFVDRELTSPDGVFYTSLDADAEGEEGRFYVWTVDELAAAITDAADLALVKRAFSADGLTNFENRAYILLRRQSLTDAEVQRLEALKPLLLAARNRRPRPNLDTKVLTSWNGLMIAGLAAAGRALDDQAAIARAARAADFLLKAMRTDDGRLFHVYAAAPGEAPQPRVPGYLDDATHLVHGLLTLHDVTGEARWLAAARELTDAMTTHFHDPDRGGFYFTPHDHEALFVRMKDQHDGVQPSGNSQAALNLLRLAQATGEPRYRNQSRETLRTLAPALQDHPSSLCTLARALAADLDAPPADKK